ncbi:hypothetical protein [Phocaeicola plebeius]|uniref:hypothetical protein n=1 Tax=Phocaeicola plebeius TaxID=310297 RepID=UPI0026F2415A|nr:hypothetical protein [Phocaeicola plebeius]
MSKQVLDVEQMMHLKELGVDTSKASAKEYIISETENYCGYSRNIVVIDGYIENFIEQRKAFTLDDVLSLLPDCIDKEEAKLNVGKKSVSYEKMVGYSYDGDLILFHNDILLEAAYEMLCWCAENGYLNHRQYDEQTSKEADR